MEKFRLLDKVKVVSGLLKGHSGKIVYDLLDGCYKVRLDNDHTNIIQGYNLELIDRSIYTKEEQIELLTNRWQKLKEWVENNSNVTDEDYSLIYGFVLDQMEELEKEIK